MLREVLFMVRLAETLIKLLMLEKKTAKNQQFCKFVVEVSVKKDGRQRFMGNSSKISLFQQRSLT